MVRLPRWKLDAHVPLGLLTAVPNHVPDDVYTVQSRRRLTAAHYEQYCIRGFNYSKKSTHSPSSSSQKPRLKW